MQIRFTTRHSSPVQNSTPLDGPSTPAVLAPRRGTIATHLTSEGMGTLQEARQGRIGQDGE